MQTTVLIFKKISCITEWLYLSLKQQKNISVLDISETLRDTLVTCKRREPKILLICGDNQPEIRSTFEQLLATRPALKIIVLTKHTNLSQTKEILAAGAFGHIALEHSTNDELITAIEYAMNDRAYISRAIATELANESRNQGLNIFSRTISLANREEQVLKLIAKGHRSKEISFLLHIAQSTVEVHRRNIMRKTGLHKVADLTRYAIHNRLIESF
jgi:two-component system NarL family response regulator